MTKPEGEQFRLYHGTAGKIEGNIVLSKESGFGKGAYASTSLEDASKYASAKARERGRTGQGTLFGTVYRVTPKSSVKHIVNDTFVDPEGLDVVEAVAFPPTYRPEDYERSRRRAEEIKKYGFSNIIDD